MTPLHFAAPYWMLGCATALLVAFLLVAGGLRAARSVSTFGDEALVRGLLTSDAATRRAWKGVLLVLATALCFVAAARPQYGKGTRLIPATNLDVVVVLDYSKSMYAQDVEPSRIFRAKVEAARLVKQLRGARFGAVAFAGEAMGFPLTADGAAIAQFLRQLEPNDMPVGGTAIARALSYARNLLQRDPKSGDHKRVVLLVTDGEDLEGDPVAVARAIGAEGTTIHVVQIGGRTPEPIPEIDEQGRATGWRRGRDGQPLTTALTVEGEQQLQAIAAATPGGVLVRAAAGTTGIDEIAGELRRQMKGELGERVETVYADVYYVPLGLAIGLLCAEVFLSDARRRKFVRRAPPPRHRPLGRSLPGTRPSPWERPPTPPALGLKAKVVASTTLWLVLLCAASAAAASAALTGCSGWEPSEPFERNAPAVDEAIREMDGGRFESAEQLLEEYLGTGPCGDAGLGLPPLVRERPNASFDLGLVLFHLGEKYGRRFGEEEEAAEDPEAQKQAGARALEVDCAQIVVKAIAADTKVPIDLRARAYYLSGNLEFLRAEYQAAVREYDSALGLVPGLWPEAGPGDDVGRDAAWNRAIALRRIREHEDAGQDGGADADAADDSMAPDARPDGSDDAGEDDGGSDAGAEDGGQPEAGAPDAGGPDGGDQDSPKEDGGAQDGGNQGGEDAAAPQPQPEEPQEQPGQGDEAQRDRILDELEQTPTYQQQEAKKRAGIRPRYRMEDK